MYLSSKDLQKLAPSDWVTVLLGVLAGLVLLLFSATAEAQTRTPSTCLAIAKAPYLNPLQLPLILSSGTPELYMAQSPDSTVNIRYAVHSTYRITSPGGVVLATDFAGRAGTGRLPDVVTMNHAHGTHYTVSPDPSIPHVLRGWPDGGIPAAYHLEVEDVLIRNVPTDIYRSGVLIEENGNSIFIFETAGLCIGHVGHLHHTLTPEHFAAIGRLDVLMVPVDGSVTMTVEGMADLARRFRSSIILPMHWFSSFSLQRFVESMRSNFIIDVRDDSDIDVSLFDLPNSPTVIVLQPEMGFGTGFGFD